ncbi:oocyte zinc finger protein XlCOF7.1-like isoform X2 [Pseudophryne corroboree]|uniref:oocyte zinc finger protein XlCOF7.1-like isoform X2 n=1 Tax=Pseudophryne corroboree TaxID=495146 RepID=UPI003081ECF8
MAKCLVEGCRNCGGEKPGVIMHLFPNSPGKIKTWLRFVVRSGRVIGNIEELAQNIFKGKTEDRLRICSEHFTEQSYQPTGLRKALKKGAVPTIFPPQSQSRPRLTSPSKRGAPFNEATQGHASGDNTGLLQPNHMTLDSRHLQTHHGSPSPLPNHRPCDPAYTLVKKPVESQTPISRPCLSQGFSRTQSSIMVPPPHSLIHDRDNDQKILELTNKIIQLLTGEVPIRCEDVTVHFSMDEWEYIEGHKDLYKDMMENQETLSSPDVPINYEAEYTSTHIKEEPVSCDGGDLTHTDMYTPTDTVSYECGKITAADTSTDYTETKCSSNEAVHAQYLYKREQICQKYPLLYKGNIDADVYALIKHAHTKYSFTRIEEDFTSNEDTSTHINKESVSHDGEDTDTDMYTPTDHTQYTSTHSKEEPVSCDGGDLTDTDMYTPTDHTQYTSTHIKEEPVSCDGGDLTDTGMYTPTGHTQYTSTHSKEEPVSCDGGDLTHTDVYTPTSHTQYTSSHIKEEPVSCDGDLQVTKNYTPTGHTQYTSTHIKEEPDHCDGGNLADTDLYTPTGHTQYTSTHIKEEPDHCEGGDLTDTDNYTPTGHTQYTSTHTKEEPVSCDRGDLTHSDNYTPTGHTQCTVSYECGKITAADTSTDCTETKCSSNEAEHAQKLYKREQICQKYPLLYKGNIDADVYALIKHAHTKYSFTRIEGFTANEDERVPYTDMYTPTDHPLCTPHTTEESVSCGGGNITSANTYTHMDHSQYTATHHITKESIPPTAAKLPRASSRLDFKCPECSERFAHRVGFADHRRSHRREKLTCPDCGKLFSNRSSLLNHLTSHTGEKPHVCPTCGKCFARKSNLMTHRRIHTGDTSCKCLECGRSFLNEADLAKHQIVHEN